MNLIEEASSAIDNLHKLTISFADGGSPDAFSVLGYQSKITKIHKDLGQEMARKFGKKEGQYLARKIAEAKMYRQGRKELKTVADSSQQALTFVENDMIRENQAAEEYESYRLMLQSLDKAFQHSMQTVSFLGKAESHPS